MWKRIISVLLNGALAMAWVPSAAFAATGEPLAAAQVAAQSEEDEDVVVPEYMKAGFDTLALDVGESF